MDNENLLNEIKKLKEATSNMQNISKIFVALETIANKHVEINSSFEENLSHLDGYNEQFSDLNNSIRSNLLDLKETALKFPEQLSDISDKNKINLENCENRLKKDLLDANLKLTTLLANRMDIVSNSLKNINVLLILTFILNIIILGIIVYKFLIIA